MNPGLHRGFSTPHRLNSRQIRGIIDEVEEQSRLPMLRWDEGEIVQAVTAVRNAGGSVDAFLSHIAENNPTARTVTDDYQEIMNAARAAAPSVENAASQLGGAIQQGAEDIQECGPECVP